MPHSDEESPRFKWSHASFDIIVTKHTIIPLGANSKLADSPFGKWVLYYYIVLPVVVVGHALQQSTKIFTRCDLYIKDLDE